MSTREAMTMTDTARRDLVDDHSPHGVPSKPPMIAPTTQPDAEAAHTARIEELQRRRATARTGARRAIDVTPTSADASTRPQRARVAQGSKVAAAGFGLSAMLGLVAAMGYASTSSTPAPRPEPTAAAPAQIVVVLHPANESAAPPTAPSTAPTVTTSPSQPIVLSAQPTVRQAPASQAPTGQTNGSR